MYSFKQILYRYVNNYFCSRFGHRLIKKGINSDFSKKKIKFKLSKLFSFSFISKAPKSHKQWMTAWNAMESIASKRWKKKRARKFPAGQKGCRNWTATTFQASIFSPIMLSFGGRHCHLLQAAWCLTFPPFNFCSHCSHFSLLLFSSFLEYVEEILMPLAICKPCRDLADFH